MIYIFALEGGFSVFTDSSSSSFIALSPTFLLLWFSLVGFVFELSDLFFIGHSLILAQIFRYSFAVGKAYNIRQ